MNFSFFSSRRALPLAYAAALSIALVAPLASPVVALAQSDDTNSVTNPVGVARISDIHGSVSIQRGDADTAVDAVINAPVLGADYVNTGADSRAEVEFDGGTMVRLGDNVQMRFSRIDPENRELQLAEGTIEFRLLQGVDGQTTIDTPSVSVVPRDNGTYRITVTPDGQTKVTVRSGHADIDAPNGTQTLNPGRTLIAEGPATEPSIQFGAEVALDEFDSFNQQRDHVHAQVAVAAPYVSPQIAGTETLPSYGTWDTDPQYGHVWVPNDVGPNWAPYQDGNWAWEDAYGWTWIAAEPWGWAPYHYGRWYRSPVLGWAWYPGPRERFAQAWSPALVGFIGFGTTIGNVGVSLGFGFGNVGWVPLAPGEAFHPWWGPHAVSVTNINVTNVGFYRNARFANSVTSVNAQRFTMGDFHTRQSFSAAQLQGEHVYAMHGGLGFVPSAANLRFSNRPFAQQQLAYRPAPSAFAGRAAVTARTPFENQRQALATSYHVAAPNERFGPPVSSGRYAAPQSETGAGFAGRADSWGRFNATRGGGFNGANAYARPAGSEYARPQGQPSYARPQGGEFARPQSQAQPSYGRPQSGEFARPQSQGQSTYSRPQSGEFVRPQYQGQSTYARPQGGEYARPQSQGQSTYARPAYGAGAGYARPQAEGQRTYGRPAGGGYARPSGGSAPARGNASGRETGHERNTR